ncbi:MAG: PP0621 family protein [Pseudomonadota bacterium]
MSKLIFLLLLGLIAFLLFKGLRGGSRTPRRPRPRIENMVACAVCGVRVPESESLSRGDLHYCCEEHLKQSGR